MNRLYYQLFVAAIISLFTHLSHAQCKDQVLHDSGAVMVGVTMVTVESVGPVDLLPTYCKETTPYHIGYKFKDAQSGTGSYIFTFDPPISMARLNFSGISNVVGSAEEVSIWVNGLHFKVTEAGKENGCDEPGIITKRGNVGVKENTPVGGWLGTVVTGPISTLELKDTVLNGQPAGALFSLFICPGLFVDLGPDTTLCEGENIILNPNIKKVTYKWQDGSTDSAFRVSKPGTYWVEVNNKEVTYRDSINITYNSCTDKEYIPRSEHWKHMRESGG